MTADPLVEFAQAALIAIGFSMPRIFVFMIIVPVFAGAIFPRTVRIALAAGLSAPAAVGVYYQQWMQPLPPDVGMLMLKECILGMVLGIPVAAPLWAFQSVGALMDNQRGANAAQQVTPFAQADASIIGGGLMQAVIVLLYSTGGFILIYKLLLQSYQVWPVLQLVPDLRDFGLDMTLARFDEVMYRTMLYAAPVLAIIMLVDFAFALMSVFAPQLQTYFAAMPVKSLAALAVLAVYVMTLLQHGDDYFRDVFHRETQLMESHSP